jgi:hypothetical protein
MGEERTIVNKTSPNGPQRGIGDNGGPRLQKFTAKNKVERIKEVLDMDISAAQKCVGIRIIADADTDGITPELSTEDLKRAASVKDRVTVYRATQRLEEKKVSKPVKEDGRPNRYLVLPSEAIDAVLDEMDATGVVSSHGGDANKPHRSGDEPVRSNHTTQYDQTASVGAEPTGSNPTGAVEPHHRPTPPSRARVDNNNINNINTYQTDRGEEKDRGCGGKEKPETENLDLEAEEADLKASPLEAFNLYNEMALRVGIPQARSLTPQRRKSIAARMREHGGLEAWKLALANIERSAFLQGRNDRGWTADLDFMLQAKSFTRLVEGTYGNGAHAKATPTQQSKDTHASKRERIAQWAREEEERLKSEKSKWSAQT